MPWASNGNEALWASTYRHVADVFRSVMPNVRFDWNGDPGWIQGQLAAYPGDNYVDIIGLDVYDKGLGGRVELVDAARGSTPAASFRTDLPEPRVPARLRDRARQAGQLSRSGRSSAAASEASGGVGNDDPAFIQGMYDWMNSLPSSRTRQPGVPLVLQRGRLQRRLPRLVALPERAGALPCPLRRLERRRRLVRRRRARSVAASVRSPRSARSRAAAATRCWAPTGRSTPSEPPATSATRRDRQWRSRARADGRGYWITDRGRQRESLRYSRQSRWPSRAAFGRMGQRDLGDTVGERVLAVHHPGSRVRATATRTCYGDLEHQAPERPDRRVGRDPDRTRLLHGRIRRRRVRLRRRTLSRLDGEHALEPADRRACRRRRTAAATGSSRPTAECSRSTRRSTARWATTRCRRPSTASSRSATAT